MDRTIVLRRGVVAALLLAASLSPQAAHAGKKSQPADNEKASTLSLNEVGRAFESARLLSGADRVSALARLDESTEALLRGNVTADQRTAVLYLSASSLADRGNFAGAEDAYRRVLKANHDYTRIDDDAEFAAIQAMEAQGRDAEAAHEWEKWEKTYSKSPLMSEARLAEAWNALRRGEKNDAKRLLAGIATASPWMQSDARYILARATFAYVDGKPADALTLLGPKPKGAAAGYLAALCQLQSGSLLRAAAGFQEVADRNPDSPLRDPALLAKANAFLVAKDFRSASTEFGRVAQRVNDEGVRAEAELRGAGSVFLAGAPDSALGLLRSIVDRHAGTDVAARAQFLIGEVLVAKGKPADAIVEYNRVLTSYFKHSVAASAQYRVARCLDALGRRADATGSYEAVVRGYPLEPEAPAAAYLAGVGMLAQKKPLAAAPYFQLVLDRYATHSDAKGLVVFASPEHQEIVEAALCLLEYSYHQAGNLGQLSGAPHVMLGRLPPSHSTWRAYALLIDADASAAMGRYPQSQTALESLMKDFPDHPVGAAAAQLLAWTYAQQGSDSLAIATQERLLARYGASGDDRIVSNAMIDIAHVRFNQKRFKEAAAGYEDFLRRYPNHKSRYQALYQAGLCYLRLNRAGDAVDRWEAIVRDSTTDPVAEKAWARAGDLYFQAERYADARRCYKGLLEHFGSSSAASIATLRLAQCEYNAGHDALALEMFSQTAEHFPGTPAAREAQRGTELALYRLSQSPNGEKELARLVEQFPSSAFAADAQFRIARRAYNEKRWDDAADGFRKVVSQFPSYSGADQAQFLLADSYAHANKLDDVRTAYEQFLSFFPQSDLRPTVQFRLGLMNFQAKDYARAAVAFTLALDDSVSGEVATAARYNLALCHRLLGQTDEAKTELEDYRSRYPGDARAADIAYQLGDLHEAANRLEDAKREYEQSLASKPSASLAVELQYRLGHCCEQLGDRDAALRYYRLAVASPDRDHPFRLSALGRCAALYEGKKDYTHAIEAYRDLIRNAKDRDLVSAATGRVSQLEAAVRRP
jgi:TolA-binding protein